jgi:hypothetical protein
LTQLSRHPLPVFHIDFGPNLGARAYAELKPLNSITELSHRELQISYDDAGFNVEVSLNMCLGKLSSSTHTILRF